VLQDGTSMSAQVLDPAGACLHVQEDDILQQEDAGQSKGSAMTKLSAAADYSGHL
jgi:hypothetical protein